MSMQEVSEFSSGWCYVEPSILLEARPADGSKVTIKDGEWIGELYIPNREVPVTVRQYLTFRRPYHPVEKIAKVHINGWCWTRAEIADSLGDGIGWRHNLEYHSSTSHNEERRGEGSRCEARMLVFLVKVTYYNRNVHTWYECRWHNQQAYVVRYIEHSVYDNKEYWLAPDGYCSVKIKMYGVTTRSPCSTSEVNTSLERWFPGINLKTSAWKYINNYGFAVVCQQRDRYLVYFDS